MIWEPFALAVFCGLIVSAGIYFIFVWPKIEPEDLVGRGQQAPTKSNNNDLDEPRELASRPGSPEEE